MRFRACGDNPDTNSCSWAGPGSRYPSGRLDRDRRRRTRRGSHGLSDWSTHSQGDYAPWPIRWACRWGRFPGPVEFLHYRVRPFRDSSYRSALGELLQRLHPPPRYGSIYSQCQGYLREPHDWKERVAREHNRRWVSWRRILSRQKPVDKLPHRFPLKPAQAKDSSPRPERWIGFHSKNHSVASAPAARGLADESGIIIDSDNGVWTRPCRSLSQWLNVSKILLSHGVAYRRKSCGILSHLTQKRYSQLSFNTWFTKYSFVFTLKPDQITSPGCFCGTLIAHQIKQSFNCSIANDLHRNGLP